jgi:hypothetical protein
MSLTIIDTIFSLEMIADDDDQTENKLDEIRQIPSSSYYSPSPFARQINPPECLLKSQLSNMLHRERRASISRPYFQHWRSARDNGRYSAKNSLAFSPRLGKRAYEDENESDNVDHRLASRSTDFESFLVTLVSHLQGKKIDVVYEDSTKICLSQPISDVVLQQVLDKFDINRRSQEEQDKEETRGRQSIGKHPILFRYRLG